MCPLPDVSFAGALRRHASHLEMVARRHYLSAALFDTQWQWLIGDDGPAIEPRALLNSDGRCLLDLALRSSLVERPDSKVIR